MKQIVVAGHSLGAQTVQRYAALGTPLNTKSPVTYWIGNPNSFVWMSTDRPLSTVGCPTYDVYREGYTNFTEYPMTYGQNLVNQGRSAILANYQSKQLAYARGTLDLGDDSSSCAPETTGANRNERFFNFIAAWPPTCPDPKGKNCDTVDLVSMGHDAGGMFAADAGKARLFTDNFYGNGNRSYDFGYPRQQAGDDPYPDPSLNGTVAQINNNTYAGNLTYAGCWSDSGASPTLKTFAYDQQTTTIESCTSYCVGQGFSIAGLEYGSQCFCGNALQSTALKIIESSCVMPCAGNSSEFCGGMSRLSIFSNGKPTVLPPPSTPDTIGNWSYSNCYTEATSGRALSGTSTSGSFMSLEYCGNFCDGYKYFGTEYGQECYCGNSFGSGANVTASTDCSMTCANNTLEYCGQANRLTVYTDPDWVPGTTPTSPPTGGGGSSASGPSCPASDGTTVPSGGKNFTIECGIDHAGGDLTSLSVVNFQACLDACSANSQCVDVSLSGSACYLKSTLGAAGSSPNIWGAKLVSGESGSNSSISASATSTQTGSSTSASASPTSTAIVCPDSNGTTYTSSTGQTFLIECGTDHYAGDLTSSNVASFQQCMETCATTPTCVDVSLSGSACYLKSSVGVAVSSPNVWGARIVSGNSSSSASSASSTATVSSSTQSASVSVSSSSATSSATPTVISCPTSNATTYTGASGQIFLIECGIDHAGGDMSSLTVSTFQQCIDACDQAQGCVDVSLSGSACYLKNVLGGASISPNIWGAKLISPSSSTSPIASSTTSSSSTVSVSSTSATTSASASATAVICPDANNTVYSLPSGNTYTIECGVDHYAGDMGSLTVGSFQDCIAACDTTQGCVDVSLSGSACYLKSSLGAAVSSPNIWGARLNQKTSNSSSTASSSATTSQSVSFSASSTASASPSATAVSCPASNGTVYSVPLGGSYLIECGVDHQAGDLANQAVNSFGDCIALCDQTATCIDVAMLGNTCYMKNAVGPAISSPSVWGAKLLPKAVTSSSSSATSTQSSTSPVTSTSLTSSIVVSSTSSSSSSSVVSSTSLSTTTSSSSTSSSSTTISPSTTASISTPTTLSTTTKSSSSVTPTSSSSTPSTSTVSSSSAAPTTSSASLTSSSSTSTVATSSTSASSTLPSGFSYVGCFADSSTGTRALPVSNGTSSTQTPQQCAQNCRAMGYKYSGTEYANECYCGNYVPTNNVTGSDCNMPCKGDSTQDCGAGNRLSVVVDSTYSQTFFARQSYNNWNLVGCYSDSTAKRSLANGVSLSAFGGANNATIANCMQACQARGFTYCGEEYYSECYGSNTPPTTSKVAGDDPLAAGCNYPCKGNSTESCGGSGKIIVYSTLNNATASN